MLNSSKCVCKEAPSTFHPHPFMRTGAFGRVYKGILTLPGVYTENKFTLRTLVAVKTVKSEQSPVFVYVCSVMILKVHM